MSQISTIQLELCDKIVDRLKTEGLDVNDYSYYDLITERPNLRRPAINLNVSSATTRMLTRGSYNCFITLTLSVIFQHQRDGIAGARRRKEGIYKLLESILDIITLQDFGLPIVVLKPAGYRNVTTSALASLSYGVYEMDFVTRFQVKEEDRFENAPTLSSIVAEYFLEPDVVTVRAEDDIALS